ncbi:hypothetical protein KC347_g101 [Hortaea werneckii]|nr:hypothetical protein KC347_g101 [Hortaea werneckii]
MPFLPLYGRATPGRAGSNMPVASHALTTDMTRLSDKPCAIFARQLADSGAITIRSAHRLSSMCNILSPLTQGFRHSSSSRLSLQKIARGFCEKNDDGHVIILGKSSNNVWYLDGGNRPSGCQ